MRLVEGVLWSCVPTSTRAKGVVLRTFCGRSEGSGVDTVRFLVPGFAMLLESSFSIAFSFAFFLIAFSFALSIAFSFAFSIASSFALFSIASFLAFRDERVLAIERAL